MWRAEFPHYVGHPSLCACNALPAILPPVRKGTSCKTAMLALGAPPLLPSLLDKAPRQGGKQRFAAARRIAICGGQNSLTGYRRHNRGAPMRIPSSLQDHLPGQLKHRGRDCVQVGLSKRMIDSHFMPVTHFDQKTRQTQAGLSTPSFLFCCFWFLLILCFVGLTKPLGKRTKRFHWQHTLDQVSVPPSHQ